MVMRDSDEGIDRYETLLGVDKLKGGTYLIYEKGSLSEGAKAFSRVSRLDPEVDVPSSENIMYYTPDESEKETIRGLVSILNKK